MLISSILKSELLISFLFGGAGSSLPHGFISSCSEWGLVSCCAQASHGVVSFIVEHRLWGTAGSRSYSSQAVHNRLNSAVHPSLVSAQHVGSSRASVYTPCLLSWQVNSLPLSHQESPKSSNS